MTFISNGLYGPNDRFGLYPFSCLPSSVHLLGWQNQYRMTESFGRDDGGASVETTVGSGGDDGSLKNVRRQRLSYILINQHILFLVILVIDSKGNGATVPDRTHLFRAQLEP